MKLFPDHEQTLDIRQSRIPRREARRKLPIPLAYIRLYARKELIVFFLFLFLMLRFLF